MFALQQLLICWAASSCLRVTVAFQPYMPSNEGRIIPLRVRQQQQKKGLHAVNSRRNFLDEASASSLFVFGSLSILGFPAEKAVASGGATAGGAYLLSAKQRYNERVKSGVKGFVEIGSSIESGDISAVKKYFDVDDVGSWKDFSAAGYLLANAFRRNSSAAPDSLPSVKKWKAFSAQIEGIVKSLKKKDVAGATSAYKDAIVALDEYLEKVELPTAKEIASS